MKKYCYIIIFSLTVLLANCSHTKTEKLIIFHAGSLSVPFKQAAQAFSRKHPHVDIMLEAAGSRTCARKIADLKRECDIMASADYTVIDQLLIPDHASWNIKFAKNEMAIVYAPKSKYAGTINQNNWYEILSKEEVIFSRSDPNADPCGYRAVLTMKLAELYYKQPGLAGKLLAKNLNYIRPKETDLLALLESHALDYIFLYRSVAQQHNLKYLILPDEINLKDPKYSEFYRKAQAKISGKEPGASIIKTGAPMIYGITIIKNAPHYKTAEKFVDFILSKTGQDIMERNGQSMAIPSPTDTYNAIPGSLKKYALKK